jgi:hypothetical protein
MWLIGFDVTVDCISVTDWSWCLVMWLIGYNVIGDVIDCIYVIDWIWCLVMWLVGFAVIGDVIVCISVIGWICCDWWCDWSHLMRLVTRMKRPETSLFANGFELVKRRVSFFLCFCREKIFLSGLGPTPNTHLSKSGINIINGVNMQIVPTSLRRTLIHRTPSTRQDTTAHFQRVNTKSTLTHQHCHRVYTHSTLTYQRIQSVNVRSTLT